MIIGGQLSYAANVVLDNTPIDVVVIGEGENTVGIRFGERQLTAAMIEQTVNSLREVLNEADAQVTLAIKDGVEFESGFEAKEFAKIVGIEFRPGDISQDE